MSVNIVNQIKKVLVEIAGDAYAKSQYILGISGGVDSMVLLDAMVKLISPSHLVGAHFNHGLRGEDSDKDEQFVADSVRSLGMTFKSGHLEGKGFSEEELRNQRLAFFERIRLGHKAQYIVLAQQANDQLETFMMRFIRGTGLDGLKGMRLSNGPILRPMITVPKNDIVHYAQSNQVVFRQDLSNFSDMYFRNRVRNRLIPVLDVLAEEFGGEKCFFDRFSALMKDVGWAVDFLEQRLSHWYERHCVETPFWIRLSRKDFQSLHFEWKLRLSRKLSARLGNVSLNRKQILELVSAVDGGVRRHVFGGKLDLIFSCGFLFFRNEIQRKVALRSFVLFPTKEGMTCPELGLEIHIDPALLKHCEGRFFSPGDRFGGQKLKRLFLERKIPSVERKFIPMLFDKRSLKIIWIFPQVRDGILVRKATFPFSFLERGLSETN